MKGPIVSIDVSNGNSHFQCFTQRGTKMGKVHRISHTVEGFNFLKSKIEELEKKTNEEVIAVYEATGVYTKPLERFLSNNTPSRRYSQRNKGKQKYIIRKQIKKTRNPSRKSIILKSSERMKKKRISIMNCVLPIVYMKTVLSI